MILAMFAWMNTWKQSPNPISTLSPTDQYAIPPEWDDSTILSEVMFRKMLSVEKSRSKYSGRSFVLMFVQIHNRLDTEGREAIWGGITQALSATLRVTDLQGWYEENRVIGILCTEIGSGNIDFILDTLHTKVDKALGDHLSLDQMNSLRVSSHVFAGDRHIENGGGSAAARLYPERKEEEDCRVGPVF